MSETLFFRESSQGLHWLLFDQFGNRKEVGDSQTDEFNERFGTDFDGRAVFVVPGEDVLMTVANVPSRQYRQIVQAVPYVVEEQLASDVEDCFFALGDRNGQGEILVSVCDIAQMDRWTDFLSGLQLTVETMISETSLVPARGVSGVVDGSRVHLRWENGAGLSLPGDQLPLALSTDSEEFPLTLSSNESGLEHLSIQLNELEAVQRDVTRTSVEEDGFYLLCCQFDGTQTNLLQGPYKVEVKRGNGQMIWRSVAILTGFAVLLHLLLLAGQGIFMSRKADEYQAATMELYQSVFPGDRNVRDVRRRWNSHLGRSDATGGGEFIALFAQATQGLPGTGLTLQNVNFNESRGDLILQVLGDRSETLVQYTQRLTTNGLKAEIGTISQEGDSVRGSIKIRATGGAS